MAIFSRIAGTGAYLPERILTNADLEQMVETSDQWIIERTGISRRHIMADHETTSTMAEMASRKAIEAAGISAKDIELIIIGTSTPDRIFPSTATILQDRLGIYGCTAFDVSAACAGFLYGVSIADKFIRTGAVKNALVIGAESLTRLVDWMDRSTCILFGDGAGAVVLQASDKPGILSTHTHADGRYHGLLYAANHIGELKEPPYLRMKGSEVFKLAVNAMGNVAEETLEHNKMDRSQIDWLVPHQANLRIIKATAKKLDMPMERVVLTVEDQGNTSAASIPVALDIAVRDGRIKRGENVMCVAFGGGLTWGSALFNY